MAFYRARYSNKIFKTLKEGFRSFCTGKQLGSSDMFDPPTSNEPPIPQYKWKRDETIELKKARLLYQSRKRGMLENGLLLSTFAAKYLQDLSPSLLEEYDNLINNPSNDWDIFYWATGVKPTPEEFDNKIMIMLKEHVQNSNREARIKQPDLY